MDNMVVNKRSRVAVTHFRCSCLRGTDDACLEQIDFCTPIHLTLHQLELCDLTFGLTVRPWLDDRGLNGVAIRDDALGERAERTCDRGDDPWIEVGGLLLAHDFVETIDQVAGLEQRWDIVRDLGHDRCLIPRYLIAFDCHKPRNLACRRGLPHPRSRRHREPGPLVSASRYGSYGTSAVIPPKG